MDREILMNTWTPLFPIDGAMLSGYQMIKEQYEDGSTYKDYVLRSWRLSRNSKSLNPELRIHVELTSIQKNRVIRKAILTRDRSNTFIPLALLTGGSGKCSEQFGA